tara:strand:+ start:1500 stop:2552 length:1053 start_codon:yes stop_codon:yes gene_type:complete
MENEINDIRTDKELRTVSFSGYKRTDVVKQFYDALVTSKLEEACYWSAELVCSGHYMDLWNTVLMCMAKNIHFGNPKLASYLDMRITTFRDIMQNGFVGQELRLRNSDKLRKLIGEISLVMCLSKKKHSIELIKLNKKETFDLTKMNHMFKADDTGYANQIFRKDDPKELFVAINEIMYHLSPKSASVSDVCWWIEWVLAFEQECGKRKAKCICDRREYENVPVPNQKEIIWIIWEAILATSAPKSTFIKKSIQSLFQIFTLRYTPGIVRRRRHIIYFAVSVLFEYIDGTVLLINDKHMVNSMLTKIDNIYKQIKKSEQAPKTDYLFTNVKQTNLDQTIKKLEMMNSMMG